MPDRIPCRCLLHDAYPDMETLIRSVLDSMPEDERLEKTQYKARLDLCLQCSHLADGTCVLCGCYVESRAARRGMKCPDVPCRWAAWEE